MSQANVMHLCYECKWEWEPCNGCSIVYWADLHPEATIDEGADSVVECDNFADKNQSVDKEEGAE